MGRHATWHTNQQQAALWLNKLLNLYKNARLRAIVNPPTKILRVQRTHPMNRLTAGSL